MGSAEPLVIRATTAADADVIRLQALDALAERRPVTVLAVGPAGSSLLVCRIKRLDNGLFFVATSKTASRTDVATDAVGRGLLRLAEAIDELSADALDR